ncbi:glycosyltransferase [Pontibacter anaerobius]|uniref:Glycosyltransferase n=1 Tax=Pontibacter anaerobius TaxID=2993940 RepID=A0ABT3RDM7_9BACT|nr:glycosyltransferase [Pontibacter anaerobius]MCX2739958.1 glycosyltransferase [Pontibacter anaerobius]
MKILQLIQKPQPRGAEIFAAQLSDNLSMLGHTSELLAIFDSPDSYKYSKPHQLLEANPSARLWDRQGWKNLSEVIQTKKPDIVQANAGDTLKYAVFSKLLYKWKQPIVFRNASTLSSYIKSPVQKLYNGFLYRKTDAIASVSNHSKEDLVRLYPGLNLKTTTIPIGLEDKQAVKNPFAGNQEQQVNLVHVGGFSFEKNHEGLLRIFQSVVKKHSNAHLWLVGDGPSRKSIEEKAKELNLLGSVHFTGFVNNPLDYIAHAQGLLLPSIIEGLPGVILEAMLYETPVVAYNVGGIREIVKHKKTGWLIEPGDELTFAQSVNNVLNLRNAEKQQITSAALNLVKENYMNLGIAERFVLLYEQLLNKK